MPVLQESTRNRLAKKDSDWIKNLNQWFRAHSRILPWRENPNPYRVWVSEIMLQQTQVTTVIPYFENFLNRFPTVQALAKANVSDVETAWAGLGYYSRARNLHAGARKVVQEAGGRFPSDRDGWLSIPGVGPYTAGAILSIAFSKPEAMIDGNIERVFSRMFRISRNQKSDSNPSSYKDALWGRSQDSVNLAQKLGIDPSQHNQSLMELGALVCKPKSPKCEICPVQESCQAFRLQETDLFPEKKPKKKWIQVQEEVHVWFIQDSILLRKRTKDEWLTGLWDFMTDPPPKSTKQWLNIGEIKSKHVVTRHKIERKTQIWKPKSRQVQVSDFKLAAKDELIWLPLSEIRYGRDQKIATGSAYNKTIEKIIQVLK